MHKQKSVVSCRILTILLQRAMEFCELVCGIWQKFSAENCGPYSLLVSLRARAGPNPQADYADD